MKLKNIIVVCDFAYIEGGASRVAHESAIALSQEYNVVLFAAVGPVSDELKNSVVEVHCLGQADILHNKNRIGAFIQGIWNNTAKKEWTRILKTYSPENTIIHVHTWTKGISSSIFKVTEKAGFKVVLTVHDYFLVCPNGGLYDYKMHCICEDKPMSLRCIGRNCDSRSYFHKLFRLCRQWVQNRSIRNRNNISYIFISEYAKEQLLKRNSDNMKKSYYLQNPVNFENRFKVDCENNSLFTYVGRLTDDKGIRIFCEAMTIAKKDAVVIGEGILGDELKKKYSNINFVGWKTKKDMVPYIKNTRCFVFPSVYYEGAPLTPLEMMACGIPCIISDKNSSKDIIIEGVNGYTYDGYSVDELAKKVELFNSNELVKKLSDNVYRDFDIESYSLETHVENLKKIYESVLN